MKRGFGAYFLLIVIGLFVIGIVSIPFIMVTKKVEEKGEVRGEFVNSLREADRVINKDSTSSGKVK